MGEKEAWKGENEEGDKRGRESKGLGEERRRHKTFSVLNKMQLLFLRKKGLRFFLNFQFEQNTIADFFFSFRIRVFFFFVFPGPGSDYYASYVT